MSYKFSKGSTVQGDIKAADDAERNTLIDFGEDQIEFQTSGSTRLKVDNTGIIVTGSLELKQNGDQEMLRFSKSNSEVAEMVFEMEGDDKFQMFLNSFENMVFATTNAADDFLLRLSGITAIYAQGNPKELRFWDSYNENYNVIVNSPLRVSGAAEFNAAVSFEDSLMAELSIPGLDLQTDTNAFRFNAPYNMDIEGLDLYLDQHSTSGNVTVTVTSGSTTMISLSLTGTNLSANTTTVTSGSINANDQVTFAITATPADAQGLRGNLTFRRRI